MNLVKLIAQKAVTLLNAVANFPLPIVGTDGGLLDSWLYDGAKTIRFDDAEITITANIATTIPGPLGIYGGRGGVEYFLGYVNNGNDVVIGDENCGYAQIVREVGAFQYLTIGRIGAGAALVPAPAANCTVIATPVNRMDIP